MASPGLSELIHIFLQQDGDEPIDDNLDFFSKTLILTTLLINFTLCGPIEMTHHLLIL